MIDSAVVYESKGTQAAETRVSSMTLVRVPGGEKITFFKRDNDIDDSANVGRIDCLTLERLCSIAADHYIDCPRMPIVVIGQGHFVVLVRSLMRSAGVLILLEPKSIDIPDITRKGSAAQFDIVAFDSVSEAVGMSEHSELFEFPFDPYYALSRADSSISSYIRSAAQFIGLSLRVNSAEYADINIAHDADVISAMLLLLLMLLKRTANDDYIEFDLKHSDGKPVLCFRTALQCEADIDTSAELAECMRIASTRNIRFDYFVSDDNTAHFEFCPSLVEWSHLGIKTRQELEYDE